MKETIQDPKLEELRAIAAPLLVADLRTADRETVRAVLLGFFWSRRPDLNDCIEILDAILKAHLLERHLALMRALQTPPPLDLSCLPTQPLEGTWATPSHEAPLQSGS